MTVVDEFRNAISALSNDPTSDTKLSAVVEGAIRILDLQRPPPLDVSTRAALAAITLQICKGRSDEPKAGARSIGLLRALVARSDLDPGERAGGLGTLGLRLSEAGEPLAAVAPSAEAVAIYRRLVAADSMSYLPNLGVSLNNLGLRLSDVGLREEALAPSLEAVAIRRHLAARDPGSHLASLSTSLHNLGELFLLLERYDEAIVPTEEAVQIRRYLASKSPDAHLQDLAASVDRLSDSLSGSGRQQEALSLATEGLALRRLLAQGTSETHLVNLGASLKRSRNLLYELRRPAEALEPANETVKVYRILASGNPEGHLPDLATCLAWRAALLFALAQSEQSMASLEEAIGITRHLAASKPELYRDRLANLLHDKSRRFVALHIVDQALVAATDAVRVGRESQVDAVHLPNFSRHLNNFAELLVQFGRVDEALAAAEEALEIDRRLVEFDAPNHLPKLAESLTRASVVMSRSGKREAGLGLNEEAIAIYRDLVRSSHEEFLPDLAMALSNHGPRMSELGRKTEALESSREAVDINRRLVALDPETHNPHLATSLNNLSLTLTYAGLAEEAVGPISEAIGIRRMLASIDPANYLAELASSLNNLAFALSDSGLKEESLAPSQEAVSMYRELSRTVPTAHLADLATSLTTLGATMLSLGRRIEAAQLSREAVTAYRELASDRASIYQQNLATSLNNLSTMILAMGDAEAALVAAQESLAVRRAMANLNPDAHEDDLASSLNTVGFILFHMSKHAEAWKFLAEAVEIRRRLADTYPRTYLPDITKSLSNLSVVLSQMGRGIEAIACGVEATKAARRLMEDSPVAYAPILATSLINLSQMIPEVDRAETWLEIVGLEVGLALQSAALRGLLDLVDEVRPAGSIDVLSRALERLTRSVRAELLLVGTAEDRRRLLEHSAWLAADAAVFLACEANRCEQALEWLEVLLGAEAALVASRRDSAFSALQNKRPDLALRLARAVDRVDVDLLGPEDRDNEIAESPSQVLAEIRTPGGGFESFLLPRQFEEIAAICAGSTVAWLLSGSHRGGLLVLRAGQASWQELPGLANTELVELLSATLRASASDAAHRRLRRLVDTVILPYLRDMQSMTEDRLVLVPVGLTAWLPIQARTSKAGFAVEIRHTAIHPQQEPHVQQQDRPAPLIAHSDGPDPTHPLHFGRAEAEQVAQLCAVEHLTDPSVTAATVLERLACSPLVHLCCHGTASADPMQSTLYFGSGISPEHRLTLADLGERLRTVAPPRFVGLSACETARTESIAPEQATGFPTVLLAHGTAAVLATLWPVHDHVARDVALGFYRRWAGGLPAGAALTETLNVLYDRLPLSPTLDAFCLYGDPELIWPLSTPTAKAANTYPMESATPTGSASQAGRSTGHRLMLELSDHDLVEELELVHADLPDDDPRCDDLAAHVNSWLDATTATDSSEIKSTIIALLVDLGAEFDLKHTRRPGEARQPVGAIQPASQTIPQDAKDRIHTLYKRRPTK